MKAKKLFSGAMKFFLIAIVGAFLALHSINLFSFVFPPEQKFYSWLGFGLTGLGAIAYLVMFLWEGQSVLQRVVSLAMMIICAIGEVVAAIFGMQIETWKKAGFTLTESDFNSMLLVIGILSIFHFVALIAYFAGDKISELFKDEDGNGIPDSMERKPNKPSRLPTPVPTAVHNYNMDEFLMELNIDRQTATQKLGANPDEFYANLRVHGIQDMDISRNNVARLYGELRANGHKVNP